VSKPKIIDDDHSEIRVEVDEKVVQSWFYLNKAEHDMKMKFAWYFCDGFLAGREVLP